MEQVGNVGDVATLTFLIGVRGQRELERARQPFLIARLQGVLLFGPSSVATPPSAISRPERDLAD